MLYTCRYDHFNKDGTCYVSLTKKEKNVHAEWEEHDINNNGVNNMGYDKNQCRVMYGFTFGVLLVQVFKWITVVVSSFVICSFIITLTDIVVI